MRRRTLPKLSKSEIAKTFKKTRLENRLAEIIAENVSMRAEIFLLDPPVQLKKVFPSILKVIFLAALIHGLALVFILVKSHAFGF